MKGVVTDIHRYGDSLMVNGYFDNGTHFHGQLEEPLLGEARALFAKLADDAAARLRQREAAVANQMRGMGRLPSPYAAAPPDEFPPGGSL